MNIAIRAIRTLALVIVSLAFAGCAVTIVPPTATVGGTLYQPQKSCTVDTDARGSSQSGSSRNRVQDTKTCTYVDQTGRVCKDIITYTTAWRTEKDKNGKTVTVSDPRSSTSTSCRTP